MSKLRSSRATRAFAKSPKCSSSTQAPSSSHGEGDWHREGRSRVFKYFRWVVKITQSQKLDGSTIYGPSLWLLVNSDTGVLLWGKELELLQIIKKPQALY